MPAGRVKQECAACKNEHRKRPLRCAVARKGNGLFLSGFHPLFRCTHTAMRRGRRRCKIGIARSIAKTGHAESFLKFIKLAAHDPCRKAGAIWRTSQAALLLPSGQSHPRRRNRCKLAGKCGFESRRVGGQPKPCRFRRVLHACIPAIGSEMPRHWAARHPIAVLPAERRRLWHIARALCAFEKCAGAVRYPHLFVRTREAFNPAKASKVTGPSGCMVECRALPAGEQPLLRGAASAFLFRLWRRCRFRRAGPFFGKQLAVA